MRTHYLAEIQDRRNKAVLSRLGWIGIWQVCLVAAMIAAGAWIYTRPAAAHNTPHIISADGATDYGDALFIGSDSVVCLGNVPGSATLDLNGNHIPVTKIGSGMIGDSRVSLLQLQESASADITVNPVQAHTGDRVTASSSESGWDGTITEVQQSEYIVEPAFSLGQGMGVFARDDPNALVGMSAEKKGRMFVAPIETVMAAVKPGNSK